MKENLLVTIKKNLFYNTTTMRKAIFGFAFLVFSATILYHMIRPSEESDLKHLAKLNQVEWGKALVKISTAYGAQKNCKKAIEAANTYMKPRYCETFQFKPTVAPYNSQYRNNWKEALYYFVGHECMRKHGDHDKRFSKDAGFALGKFTDVYFDDPSSSVTDPPSSLQVISEKAVAYQGMAFADDGSDNWPTRVDKTFVYDASEAGACIKVHHSSLPVK